MPAEHQTVLMTSSLCRYEGEWGSGGGGSERVGEGGVGEWERGEWVSGGWGKEGRVWSRDNYNL